MTMLPLVPAAFRPFIRNATTGLNDALLENSRVASGVIAVAEGQVLSKGNGPALDG